MKIKDDKRKLVIILAVSLVGNQLQGICQCLPHVHQDWEILLNLEGEGQMYIGSQCFKFAPGTIVCQPPNVPHYKTAAVPFKDIFIHVNDPRLPLHSEIIVLNDDSEHTYEHLFFLALRAFFKKTKNSLGVVDAICETIYQMIQGEIVERRASNDQVEQLKNCLIMNFTNPDYHAHVAVRTSAYSDEHLRRCFKADTGTTPQDYLNNLRIEYARRLLHAGAKRMTIAEIAYSSGFSDPLYFSRIFRRKTGLSPRQFASGYQQESTEKPF